jgi:acyl carrier protein|tara:strand:- start:92 stop:319 length:228 start_codon:yes stop_codon:yes gene_type:complete
MSKINLEQIVSIVSKIIKINEKDININSKSSDFYKWDSLAQVNIILEIEKITEKKIKANKMGELTSIKSILNYLK